ncbi:MAG: hypothetical protein AAF204_02040 [Pseudomonadota bacterium]
MNRHFDLVAGDLIKTLKETRNSGYYNLKFSLEHITLDIDNWWKHLLPERVIRDIEAEFSESARDTSATVLDCSESPEGFIVNLEANNLAETLVYGTTDFDMLCSYRKFLEDSTFQKISNICNAIGGLSAGVTVNALDQSGGDFEDYPTVVIQAVDDVPLVEKLERFEKYGPTH